MKITLLTGKTFDIKEAVGMDIKVVQSASSRKMILHIDNKKHIPVLSIPKYCTRKRAINFVNENMDWILETLRKLPERKYFCKAAEQEFYKLSAALAAKIDCKINGICIKDTKSRWGSCSTLNNINYNWRIALAPKYVIDYLMAHEVSHLKHQNHSPAFWQCVANLYPDWKKGHTWLQKNGRILYTYF